MNALSQLSDQIFRYQTDVESLKRRFSEIEENCEKRSKNQAIALQDVDEKAELNRRIINRISTDIQSVRSEMSQGFAETVSKISSSKGEIQRDLAMTDQKMVQKSEHDITQAILKVVPVIDSKVADIYKKSTKDLLGSTQDNYDFTLNHIKETKKELKEEIKNSEWRLNRSISSLKDEVTPLKDKVDSLENKVDSFISSQNQTNSEMIGMMQQIINRLPESK